MAALILAAVFIATTAHAGKICQLPAPWEGKSAMYIVGADMCDRFIASDNATVCRSSETVQ